MDQEKEMFTYNEAKDLLKESWRIKNFEERLKNDRKNLVDEIVQVIHENVAFQSISMLSTSDRNKRPSNKEIKERCVLGVGGLCCELAPFTWGLFKALGFSVKMLNSRVTSTMTTPNNHALVLIFGLENQTDIHLIDCGTGFPTFRAISINFSKESPIFRDSFLEYKYIRLNNGLILRMHGEGDRFRTNNPPKEGLDFFIGHWRRFYSFDPSQNPHDPQQPGEDAYRTVVAGLSPFTSSPRAIWFPRKHAVAITNNKLMIENEDGKLLTTVLENDEEILKAYKVHFPQLKQETVQRALAEWHRVAES
ncbi:uncharacterized protein LOC114521490 [Dendronephthya gigantea]|uniref:uncharacterized protein LOC114521490 n=1 Tax=Dendronephthya gigantea TaxID=151771 RepID=UPI001068F846|nr:uncharacterized protein LOC114521490 [Dendronephthya gigantea]